MNFQSYSHNVEIVQIQKVMDLKTDIKWKKCYCDMESHMNDSTIHAFVVNTKPEIEKSGFGISAAN